MLEGFPHQPEPELDVRSAGTAELFDHLWHSRLDRQPPAHHGSSWPRRGPGSGRRCRSPPPARRRPCPDSGRPWRTGRGSRRPDRPVGYRGALMASRSSGRDRRARMPAWMAGWSVLTRPSIISGNPVTSETPRTGNPAAESAEAVPPVDTSSTPRAASPRPRSARPVLSETLRIARNFVDLLDIYRFEPLLWPVAGRPAIVSRGRALAVFFCVHGRAGCDCRGWVHAAPCAADS